MTTNLRFPRPSFSRPKPPFFRLRAEVPEPNRRLATDLTTAWTRRDGVLAVAAVVPTVNCGRRFVLALEVIPSHDACPPGGLPESYMSWTPKILAAPANLKFLPECP